MEPCGTDKKGDEHPLTTTKIQPRYNLMILPILLLFLMMMVNPMLTRVDYQNSGTESHSAETTSTVSNEEGHSSQQKTFISRIQKQGRISYHFFRKMFI